MPTHGLSPLWSLSLFLPGVQYEQHDAADQRERSDDRGNKVPFRGLYMQRAEIDRFSSGLVSDTRVSEHDDAENDQYAGNDGFGSHGTSSFLASIRQTNGFLHRSSSLNDVDQHHDNGKHQQEVNEPSYRVTAHQPQQPQHYQYYSNRPQHEILLSLGHGFTALAAPMVICFVTLLTLSSFAAFFGLSFLDIL